MQAYSLERLPCDEVVQKCIAFAVVATACLMRKQSKESVAYVNYTMPVMSRYFPAESLAAFGEMGGPTPIRSLTIHGIDSAIE